MSDPDYTLPISQTSRLYQQSQTKYGYKVLSKGDVIGEKYQIIKELGSGGFATTYLAVIIDSKEQKCVLKQLQPRFNSLEIWENAKERLDTEGMVLRWLGKHDQIPELIDHFDENGQFFLVLEFIEGEELDREVQRNLLNENSILLLLSDVLQILDFVHQQGVIHRDIKPSNLIRRHEDGKMTLIDFGAVKEIGTALYESPQTALQTQVIGTPGYMSPEQNNGKPVYSSDIYALGKTAIYGLTGKSPVEWEQANGYESTNWWKTAEISRELAKAIEKMISPRPRDRYQSAQEVLRDINPLLKVGKTIQKRYQILKYLGGEGQNDNYLVKDISRKGKTKFYLKVLRSSTDTSLNIKKLDRYLTKEIEKINHISPEQDVLKILECFIDSEQVCLVQEYIPGSTVQELISREKSLDQDWVIDLIFETATVLNLCHKQEVIHGNVRPLSLLQREDEGKITLKDFSQLQTLDSNLQSGNLGYTPPEQIAGKTTFASDVYALGMTAIHCLTGISPQQLNISHTTGAILWEKKAVVDPGLVQIINKMTSLERKNRYSSVAQVLKAIKSFKRKKHKKISYAFFISIPVVMALALFLSAQWAQRTAISEFYLADIRVDRKQYRSALKYYAEGIRKLPKTRRQVQNFESAWLNKASIHSRLKEYQAALSTCEEALRYYQSYRLWNCKGLALDNLDQYEAAVGAYDKAIALEPDNVWSWNNRGDAYAKLGNVEAAVADLQQAIQLNPQQSHISLNNLGKLYFQQRSYQEAIDAYKSALQVSSQYLPAMVGLGNAYKSIQDYDNARAAYDRAIEVNPEAYEAWYGKALVAESLSKNSEARQAYQQALNIRPDWQAALDGLMRLDGK